MLCPAGRHFSPGVLKGWKRDGFAFKKGTVTGSVELDISLDASLELAKGLSMGQSPEIGPNHEPAERILK